jgi:hypothetical protein
MRALAAEKGRQRGAPGDSCRGLLYYSTCVSIAIAVVVDRAWTCTKKGRGRVINDNTETNTGMEDRGVIGIGKNGISNGALYMNPRGENLTSSQTNFLRLRLQSAFL